MWDSFHGLSDNSQNLFLVSEGYVQSLTLTVEGFLCYPYKNMFNKFNKFNRDI